MTEEVTEDEVVATVEEDEVVGMTEDEDEEVVATVDEVLVCSSVDEVATTVEELVGVSEVLVATSGVELVDGSASEDELLVTTGSVAVLVAVAPGSAVEEDAGSAAPAPAAPLPPLSPFPGSSRRARWRRARL